MNKVTVDGRKIFSEKDFYNMISDPLGFGPYFGNNLNAFWDRLSRDVERPACIVWEYHEISKENLGSVFEKIVEVMEDAKQEDEKDFHERDKFTYYLK